MVATGKPAVVNGTEQTGKDVEDADDLVNLLHRMEERDEGVARQ